MRFSIIVVAVVAVVIIASASGCASVNQHASLSAPPSSAPLAEREQAYERLKPMGVAGTPDPTSQLGWLQSYPFPFLQLSDGQRVVDAADLVAVVDDDSLTAKAARKSGEAHLLTNALWTGGVLGIALGTGLALTAPAVVSAGASANDVDIVSVGVVLSLVGLGLVTAGTVGAVIATDFANIAEAEKMSAFLLYDRDLRHRLALVQAAVDPPPVVVPATTPPAALPVDPSGE